MLQPLPYIGRQASRSDGQARRIAILEATLRLIVAEGVRGVRHRAVAKLAAVPLASTTYYFGDIKELIHDALTFHAHKTMVANLALEQQSFSALSSYSAESLAKPEQLQALRDMLTGFICGHIKMQVADRDERILEMAFQEEALRNPVLAEAIILLDEAILVPVTQFFARLEHGNPGVPARQIIALIRFLEYRYSVRQSFDGTECELSVRDLLNQLIVAPAV
ncbi:TetR/AcrR family transcriptional regulator [Shewanella sp.]|uniref:TetR/AcrR family transcriptional regulator n=1 Tax=Shewanella sp. TaxID=50422 RepID=UPI003562F5EF